MNENAETAAKSQKGVPTEMWSTRYLMDLVELEIFFLREIISLLRIVHLREVNISFGLLGCVVERLERVTDLCGLLVDFAEKERTKCN